MNIHFNLVDEPWLPCIQADGKSVDLGLRDALVQAHTLRELYGETPLVTAALHRLLLAILHRVFGPDDDPMWEALWLARRWDVKALDAYFAEWRPRFDLFDLNHPFYQVPDPPSSLKPRPISKLTSELASGNNATLFDHTTDAEAPSFSPLQAARRLVTAQAFSVGGGQSGIRGRNFRDAPCTKGILFLVEGETLFETLALNLVHYDTEEPIPGRPEDRPAWEMDNSLEPDRRVPLGYLDYLTWQSRLVKLLPVEKGGEIKINQMFFSQGLWLEPTVEDPAKAFRLIKDRGWVPLRFNEDKALWRESASLFGINQSDNRSPIPFGWVAEFIENGIDGVLKRDQIYRYMAIGLKTDERQAAAIHFHRHERMPLPLVLLRDEHLVESLRSELQAAEDAGRLLRRAGWELARWLVSPIDREKAHREDIQVAFNQLNLELRYWSHLEVPFREFILALPDDEEAAVSGWRTVVLNTARDAFSDAVVGVGDSVRGLKAAVMARHVLERGLRDITLVTSEPGAQGNVPGGT